MAAKRLAWLFPVLAMILALAACPPGGDDDDDDDSADDDTGDDDSGDDTVDDDAADDDTGDDDTGDDDTGIDPVVFIQITDLHQCRASGDDMGRYESLLKDLTYVRDVIAPDFVVATGDLTHASNGNEQHQEEWDDYRNAVLDSGYSTADYYDVPGNHDAAGDGDFTYYLANGISGSLRHSWEVEKDGQRYAFVAVTSAHDGGIGGRVDQDLLDWTRGEFEALAPGAAHLFLFAHHNGPLIPDAGYLNPGGLVDEFDVTGYVAGHHHIDFEQTTAGTRFAKTKNQWDGMPDSDDGWMRLFVLTGPTWATRTGYMVDRGPMVIVTSPQDERLAVTRSPAAVVSGLTPITAMAVGDGDPSLVMTVDTFDPIAMTTEDGRTFTAEFDFVQAAPGEHVIRVEDANRSDDTNGIDEITVESAL